MTKSKTAGLDQNLLLLAKQGDPEAQLQIAACYAEGNGVEQNDRKAFLWFDKAARQGHAIAQYALGLCYEEGRGVYQYYRGAGRWYKHSAKQGFVYAQLKMGDWYTLGLPPVLKNESTALSWYKKAMQDPFLLDGASIFGASGGKLLGGGEAGREIVIGESKAIDLIRKASGDREPVNVTINVYARENQDVNALADVISRKLQKQLERRAAVYA